MSLPLYERLKAWHRHYESTATAALKLLLENKHLYQSALIDLGNVANELAEKEDSQFANSFLLQVSELSRPPWRILDRANPPANDPGTSAIVLKVPDVKMFCHTCDRIEAFNSVSADEFLHRGASGKSFGSVFQQIQVFVLSFLCQSCKAVPEVFLVRREGFKLTLSGRTPTELVDVPKVIPKRMRQFYGSAVIAHQSGHTLAGVFMLRTLVEQWARSQVGDGSKQADYVMEAYMSSLPDDFKQRFSSLRALYSELSIDIHAATGSEKLFEKARGQVTEHFEARHLFRLKDVPA